MISEAERYAFSGNDAALRDFVLRSNRAIRQAVINFMRIADLLQFFCR